MDMLGTLEPDKKKDWKSYVGPMVHAYNATRHDSTGYAPFFLMFGRHPRLPIDVVLGIESTGQTRTTTDYVKAMKKRLEESYRLANRSADASRTKQKKYYDLKVRGSVLEPGDRVLVKVLAFEGRHKLADHWEPEPCVVIAQPNPDIPVYVVRREDETGRDRTLHRNHLLPIGTLPILGGQKPKKEAVKETRQRRKPVATVTGPTTETESSTSETESDSEEEEDVQFTIIETPGEIQINDTPAAEDGDADEDPTEGVLGDQTSESEDAEEHIDDIDGQHESEAEEAEESADDVAQESDMASEGENERPDVDDAAQDDDPAAEQEREPELEQPPEPQQQQPRPAPKVPRIRKPPDRYRPEDYRMVCSQARRENPATSASVTPEATAANTAAVPDWVAKANFLASLVKDKAFVQMPDNVCQTMLDLLSK